MKTRLDAVNRSTLAMIAVIVGAAVATWVGNHAEAFNPQPEPPGFGAVTLARGESMRATMVAFQEVDQRPGQKKKKHKTHVKFHTYSKGLRGFAIGVDSAAAETCSTLTESSDQSCDAVFDDGEAASFDFVLPTDVEELQVRPEFQEEDASGRFVTVGACSSAFVLSVEVRAGGVTRFVLPIYPPGPCKGQ